MSSKKKSGGHSRQNKKDENQKDKNENTIVKDERLKEELEKYLKVTEEELKEQQKQEEMTKNIKKYYDQKLEDIKLLKSQGKLEELHEFVLEIIKKNAEYELKNSKIKIENQEYSKELKYLDETNISLSNKLSEYEKYNKALLEKVKNTKDEISMIEKEETNRKAEIEKKCEDFKQEIITKFNDTEIDAIRNENKMLSEKLNEFREHSKLIEDDVKNQISFKDNQVSALESNLFEMSPQFAEIESQREKFITLNKELKDKLKEYEKTFNELSGSIDKFHSQFETGKKEFEKKAQEIFKLTKKNKELKALNNDKIIEENENLKKELDYIVSENKELADKIARLKERK